MSIVKHSPSQLAEIAAALGLEFDDISLLEMAFVHGSFVAEFPGVFDESNQRLEFLGDAVLGLIVAQELLTRFPGVAGGPHDAGARLAGGRASR